MAEPADKSVRHVVLDLDGTVYRDDRVLPATLPFLERVAGLGIGWSFMTNNTSRAIADYVARLRAMGIAAQAEQLLTPVTATIAHLQATGARRVFVLGTPALRAELAAAGLGVVDDDVTVPEAVVVGFDTGLVYERLCRAAWWIAQGLPFLQTHPDMVCPTDAPTVLVDCGAICAALSAATGRSPDRVFGKPDPSMIRVVERRTGICADRIAVVGDRLYTDMVLGRRAGARSILVLTGEATREDVAALPADSEQRPDLVCASLAEVGTYLEGLAAG